MNLIFERLRTRTAAFLHDLLTIPITWLLAYWLRFNLDSIPPDFQIAALQALPWVILAQGSLYWLLGLYRGVWRFASLPDLVRITQAVGAGMILIMGLLFIMNRSVLVPRSVPIFYCGLQLLFLAGPRLFYRWLKDHRINLSSGLRVLIIGAGQAGETLARDLLRDPKRVYIPCGFLDDKPRRQGSEVQGLPVLGTTIEIIKIVEKYSIDLLILAIPSVNAREMQRLLDLCENTGRPTRILPQWRDLQADQTTISQVRPLILEDLLGRDPVQLDWSQMRQDLTGRTVLITGAGGSIGSELIRQILQIEPARLILVDQCEFNLYQIELELIELIEFNKNKKYLNLNWKCYLLDITDRNAVIDLVQQERPAVIFHAAAYKHVPLLEEQVSAAIRNNIFGTRWIAEAAVKFECERFVLISTDKAVKPSSVMGATKWVAERICQDFANQANCRFITVRFGNVLGSAGSVVPLFQRQIEQGGPLTITHPEMERFFMTIPEACQLIMQAAVLGEGGEIFVLEMGEPVKIQYLAEQMIRLAGYIPEKDIVIKYIGLRPGEKLSEELFYDSEQLLATRCSKIRVARPSLNLLNPQFTENLNNLFYMIENQAESALRTALWEFLI